MTGFDKGAIISYRKFRRKRKVRIFMRSKKSILLTLSTIIIVFLFLLTSNVYGSEGSADYIYLSDIDYIASQSRPGWGEILKDQANGGTKISVKIENIFYPFDKGMWAHATSTLVYDISAYKDDYDYFTTYMGLNQTAASSSNGVKFYIYTSTDGKTWNLKTEQNPEVVKPGANAQYVKIDIKDANYLKLVADANGSNGNDHSVYADAKLVKGTYKEPGEDLAISVEELDEKIKQIVASSEDLGALENNTEYEYTLLKRELLKNMGNYALKRFLSECPENQEVFIWLMGSKDNYENLKLYILGGKPDGDSYYSSLSILAQLYKEYSSDFTNTELLGNPTNPNMTYGDLYKKMAMSIALTHTQRVGLWMQSSIEVNQSEPLRRYAIFKYLHKNGGMRMAATMDMTHMFEDLHLQER